MNEDSERLDGCTFVYPQLKEPITQYIASQIQIRHTLSAEFIEPIRRLPSAESAMNIWRIPSAELGTAKEWIIPQIDSLINSHILI